MSFPALNLSRKQIIGLKVLVWLGCLAPALTLAYLGWNAAHGAMPDLGANPVEYVTLSTGTTTLVLLLTSLAITPLRRITGWAWPIRFRRLLGLFAFFYLSLHFVTYIWLDQSFDIHSILKDIVKRPFITVGFAAFVLMLPLAVTSTNWSIRKMGGKNWNRLHMLVYPCATLAVIHFWWKVKADHTEPFFYGSVFVLLMTFRIVWWAVHRKPQTAAA
jgi:sulfoxide reductase heme-binding subunit YedZ